MERNLSRYYLKNDEYHIICRICNQDKHSNEYHNSPTSPIGKIYVCKDCHKKYIKKNDIDSYTQENQENAREVLTILGYNLDENIYQQFKDRVKSKYGVNLQ